ncbi:hypothetical protein H9L13_02510 [Sphingomonas lutea]|uniref:Uncharacterized protein n=1 Tax=Sphingomonas lutea TaxID=1045317 RepID=A0A7G9SIZ6_9SPHN|nr:hypothetical protein [Sphingomonas lutea]QNN67821.1 hypothetical protein H9L13_02510 [Sphingomonas lutea]
MSKPEDDQQPTAPNMRTFSLNSQAFYEAVREPRERPWIPNGALPREPKVWGPRVIVEQRDGPARRRKG